mmetsp:Transcript_141675/g.394979  ORF Transcript_141675/g.394979 Transcript_141675/m.394979 type:complete len:204 (-) Transcript_141675:1063-1674(-)
MPVQGGPRSRSNCLALSTFSVSLRPAPAEIRECGVGGLVSAGGMLLCLAYSGGCSAEEPRLEKRTMRPRTTSKAMPAVMPWWRESGTSMMVTNEGMATRMSFQAMLRLGSIMNAPVRTSGAAAARSGTALNNGVKKAENPKSIATTTAERPVRPPAKMPALLSFAMTNGLVPSSAAAMVPSAAPETMPRLRGTPPFFRSPAML